MHIKKPKFTLLIAAVALIIMLVASACSSSDPEALDLPVTIKSGVMDPGTIKVKQGDMVTLKILADKGGEFHLHTYDIESAIQADKETDFYFVAEATGRFKITYHPMSDDGHGNGTHGANNSHGKIFESEVIAPGESFSFKAHKHLEGQTIPFHSHLRPALNGSITVSHSSGHGGSVAIAYTDKDTEPHEVIVDPGSVITWTNNSSLPQSVVSGHHSDMAKSGHGADKHNTDKHNNEEEIQIGLLEVQPR